MNVVLRITIIERIKCVCKWLRAVNRGVEDASSLEYFKEEAEENGWEFYEDGSRYN